MHVHEVQGLSLHDQHLQAVSASRGATPLSVSLFVSWKNVVFVNDPIVMELAYRAVYLS